MLFIDLNEVVLDISRRFIAASTAFLALSVATVNKIVLIVKFRDNFKVWPHTTYLAASTLTFAVDP